VLHSFGFSLEQVITLSHFFSCPYLEYHITAYAIFSEYSLVVKWCSHKYESVF